MDLERRVVCVKFVYQHFRLVVVRQKNFEFQGSRLVGKTPGSVRHQQRLDPVQMPGRDFELSNNSELGHIYRSTNIPVPDNHADYPNLYFIGLFQPVGCIWPLV